MAFSYSVLYWLKSKLGCFSNDNSNNKDHALQISILMSPLKYTVWICSVDLIVWKLPQAKIHNDSVQFHRISHYGAHSSKYIGLLLHIAVFLQRREKKCTKIQKVHTEPCSLNLFFGDILVGVTHRCLLKLPIIETLAKFYNLPISQTFNIIIIVKSNGFSLIHVLTIAKIPCKQSHNQTCVNQSLMVTHHKWRKYSCFYTSAILDWGSACRAVR